MATVFRAHDRKHDRLVALKVMHPEIAGTLGPERFQREIRFAAQLQHPHILSVFDSGETAGQCWFTMPFVRGESLRDRLRREGRLPVDEALQRALSRKPADRFEHIADFARAAAPWFSTPVQTSAATAPAMPRVDLPPSGRRRLAAIVGGVGAAVVLLAGVAFMRGRAASSAESGPIRSVVLPFENPGGSADAYLADGVTDAVRGKLLALPGMEVIARSSSLPYRGTINPPREIARELEVRYLLTGTVRFDRPAGGQRAARGAGGDRARAAGGGAHGQHRGV